MDQRDASGARAGSALAAVLTSGSRTAVCCGKGARSPFCYLVVTMHLRHIK
jgi:hypothetical protein